MARSLLKNCRVYVDGYDLSGHSRSIGPLTWSFEEAVDDPMSASVKGVLNGMGTVGIGTLNGIFDNTATTGLHAVMAGAGAKRTVLVTLGMEAAPADNGIAFCGQFEQTGYEAGSSESPVTATIPFAASARGSTLLYCNPWGVMLHANAAATGASTATGYDSGAQTTRGGYMCYQVTAGNGTATIKVQDASTNTNPSFADLVSSGSINCAAPSAGIVALSNTATVKRYIRWQIALGTATTVTFALAFIRD